MSNQLIKLIHFKRLMTSHPYYIWNTPIFTNEFDIEKMIIKSEPWLLDIDPMEIDNYPQVVAQSYEYVKDEFIKYIVKYKKAYYIKSKNLDDKVVETSSNIQNDNYDFLVGGVIKYRDSIAYIDIFDIKNGILYFLKPLTSTKAKDILPIYWTTQLMLKNGIKISDIKCVTLAIQDYKKGEINFFISSKLNTNKSGRSRNKKFSKYDYFHIQDKKTGNYVDLDGNHDEIYTIYEIVADGFPINIGGRIKSKNEANSKNYKSNSENWFHFLSINKYIDLIRESVNIPRPQMLTTKDFSLFGDSPYLKDTSINSFPFLGKLSGKIIKAKDFLSPTKVEDTKYLKIVEYIQKDKKIRIFDYEEVQKLIVNLNRNVIWYDFEGYSLPFAPLDHFMPYQQLVFQCSIIRTAKGKIQKIKNIVLDPKELNVNDYFDIIKSIYSNRVSSYVVYNKSYENTRLDEMIRALSFARHNKIDDAINMVDFIKSKTIDLADFFISHRNKLPIVLIPDLFGYYSIKKIEKYITSKKVNLKTMITPYEELEIQNGSMAMMKAISRATNIMGDNEWKEIITKLEVYCENDVKAMIMIKEFLEHLINMNKK